MKHIEERAEKKAAVEQGLRDVRWAGGAIDAIAGEVGVPTKKMRRGRVVHHKTETTIRHIIRWANGSLYRLERLETAIADWSAGKLGKKGKEKEAKKEGLSEADLEKLESEVKARLRNDAAAKLAELLVGADIPGMVEELADKILDRERPIVIKAGKAKRKVKGILPVEFEKILQLASQRINVLLVGPSGCGKTYIAQKIAKALGLDFASISCSAGMSESQLAGWLIPTGDRGQFEYKESPFVRSYRDGGVFLFDEIDSADPNTMTFINAALANGHMFIPQNPADGGRVKKHKDFVCLAAANTWGTGGNAMYVGRNQLDAATLDRFTAGQVFMDYDEGVEDSICRSDVLKWGRQVRAAIASHRLRRIMSTRVLRDLSTMSDAYGWKQKDWEASFFSGWSEDEVARVRQEVR
jgi:MoxR-like ATPase